MWWPTETQSLSPGVCLLERGIVPVLSPWEARVESEPVVCPLMASILSPLEAEVDSPLTPLIRDFPSVGLPQEPSDSAPKATTPVKVKGRLRGHLNLGREELQASSFILQTIESGYVLPLKSEPTPFSRKNQHSALQNAKFVIGAIAELLDTGCIRAVLEHSLVCSPLSVVENSAGNKRLVINLRHLNRFLWKQKFKYEDLRIAMMLFKRGDYLF